MHLVKAETLVGSALLHLPYQHHRIHCHFKGKRVAGSPSDAFGHAAAQKRCKSRTLEARKGYNNYNLKVVGLWPPKLPFLGAKKSATVLREFSPVDTEP